MSGCAGCSFRGMSTAVEDAFVGVRFGEETNLTLCRSGGTLFARGDRVVVEVEGEPVFGHVEQSPMPIFKPCQKAGAKLILRAANDDDLAAHDRKRQRDDAAKLFVQERARALQLDLKVARVEFSLSGKKATIYFTAEHRVDFRQLVRETAQRFGTRVHMTQLGARDEARLLGGLGVCGKTLCCSTWLKEFRPISIQMAKRQNLSLNPSKISGQCGRLLCCLAYENDQYPSGKKGQPGPAPGAEAS
ncbi:MAG: superfamily protein [Acidobacteria bacterium]|nr:superfamily protein [Acidobacteriota bacterium]